MRHAPNGEMLTRDEKLVALILADYYDPKHGSAWPSRPLLASDALMCERHCVDILTSLERKQLISRRLGNGRGHKTEYYFPSLPIPSHMSLGDFGHASTGEEESNKRDALHAPFPAKKATKGSKKGAQDDTAIRKELLEPLEQKATTTVVDQAAVTKVLQQYIPTIDQKAIDKIISGCQQAAYADGADPATTDEMLFYLHGLVDRRPNVRNLTGFLISQLPECFRGEAYRQTKDKLRRAAKSKVLEAKRLAFRKFLVAWEQQHPGENILDIDDVPSDMREIALQELPQEE